MNVARTGPVLRAEAAAEYIGVEVQTLYNMRHEGTAPTAYKRGASLVFYAVDLDDWLDQNLVQA